MRIEAAVHMHYCRCGSSKLIVKMGGLAFEAEQDCGEAKFRSPCCMREVWDIKPFKRSHWASLPGAIDEASLRVDVFQMLEAGEYRSVDGT
jgi:hypothetical protein